MRVLAGCEISGAVRDAFRRRGHEAWSCDLLGPEDVDMKDQEYPNYHFEGDIFDIIDAYGPWDVLIFFYPCTYLTCSAEWAYSDGPYHQQVKPGTLVGEARRRARDKAIEEFKRLMSLPIKCKAGENPVGVLSTRYRKPDQIIQPYQFREDASKKTCLWLENLPKLRPTGFVDPRLVNEKPRWANQTDSGQNKLTPSDNRAAVRSKTYPGIADAMAEQWG